MNRQQDDDDRHKAIKAIADIFCGGKQVRFPAIYLSIMTTHRAILLAYLIDQNATAKSEKRTGGWFIIDAEEIQAKLCIGKNKQAKLLAKLQQQGILEVYPCLFSNDRWKINYEHLQDLLEKAS